jgi:predicted PurR-regulated permease PerM
MASILRDYDRSRIPLWLAAIVLGLAFTFIIYSFVGTFVLGLFIYYITRPIHRRLAKRIPTSNRQFAKRVPTASLAAGVSLAVIALPIIVLIAYTAYVGIHELAAFAENADLSALTQALQPVIGTTGAGGLSDPQAIISAAIENPRQFLSGGIIDALGQAVTPILGYLGAFGTALIELFVVLALAFYLLRDDHRLAAWFHAELAGDGTPVAAYLDAVDRNLKTIYFGNILNAFATAILATISYNILNAISPAGIAIPVPTLLGLLTGVGSLIPVVGMKIVYIPVTIFLAVKALLTAPTALWFVVVFALVSLVIVDTIPDLILRPYVSGRDLHTGAVMIAYIIGPLLFGWYGLFLGPLLLVLFVHFARILLPELVRGESVTAQATAGNPLDPNDDSAPEPVEDTSEATDDSETGEATRSGGESDQSGGASDTDD